jgi:hypothetical protein
MWWYMSIIPAPTTLEAGGKGKRIKSSRPARGKLARSYLKNKTRTKGLGA